MQAFSLNPSSETSQELADHTDDELVDAMETVMHDQYYGSEVVETGKDKYVINNLTAPYIIGTYDQV